MSNATAAGVFIAVSLLVIIVMVLIVRGYFRSGKMPHKFKIGDIVNYRPGIVGTARPMACT